MTAAYAPNSTFKQPPEADVVQDPVEETAVSSPDVAEALYAMGIV